MRDYLNRDGKIRFIFPIDGDCINVNDGYEKDGKVLRPERIKIFKYSTEATNNSDEN